MNSASFPGPLEGLNVIDFGHYYAGPMVGMMLADQGANVVRIVRPGTPELPPQQYRLLNRNKKLLTLDLKKNDGVNQVLSLIERSDVLIENFRPGVMRRLGLDYAAVKKLNPGLVYLSLPGFPSTDKERAHIQAWEGVVAAAAGIFTEAHFFRQKFGYPPVYASVPLSSAYGSMCGANAVLAALIARKRDGIGIYIEAPLVEAGLSTCIDKFLFRADQSVGDDIPEKARALMYCAHDSEEEQVQKLFELEEGSVWNFAGFHRSSDGRLMLVQSGKPWHAERLFKVLGLHDTLKEIGFFIESAWKGRWNKNLAYTLKMKPEDVQIIKRLISDVMKKKTADEWQAVMAEEGVPFTYIRTRDEWLALDPMLKSGVLTQMDDGHSVLTVPGRVADISGPGQAAVETEMREPQPIDAEDADMLFSIRKLEKYVEDKAHDERRKGELLAGLKVLDLCSIVAGPTAAYTLAQFGAEVIRAEPPKSFNLPLHLVNMLEVNQGKRSIVLDIKTTVGREVFEQLVKWADVVMHNRPDDIAQRLGMTLDQLQAVNPKAVVCQMTALGGTWRGVGGWEHRLGYDPMANMSSGLMAHYGSPDHPMYFGGISADLMGGFGLAFSALLGIYQRNKTGFAGEGRCSLARATTYNQLVWMISENGSSDWGEPRGQFTMGAHWWARIYRCSDRWIYVETTEERAALLLEAVTGRMEAGPQDIEAEFTKRNSAHWLERLNEVDIACHLVMTATDICPDPEKLRRVDNDAADETANGMFEILRWDDHPCGKPILLPATTWVRVGEEQSYRRLTPSPKVGHHTKEILAEIGYSETEIAELIRLKVAHEFLPAIGSKDKYFFEPKAE